MNTSVTTGELRQKDVGMQENSNDYCDEEGRPLFDAVWFVEVPSGRPSRFTPANAQEILEPHGLSTASGLEETQVPSWDHEVASDGQSVRIGLDGKNETQGGEVAGAWQRTLEQVKS